MVSKNLVQEGIPVCSKTFHNIVIAKENKTRKKSSSKKQSKNLGTPLVRTKKFANEVAKNIDCTDPPLERDLARRYGVSQTTVARIINLDLGMKYKRKQKTHKLTDKQAALSSQRCPVVGSKQNYIHFCKTLANQLPRLGSNELRNQWNF